MIQYVLNMIADIINLYMILFHFKDKLILLFFYLFILFIVSNRERFPNIYEIFSDLYISFMFYLFTKYLLEF